MDMYRGDLKNIEKNGVWNLPEEVNSIEIQLAANFCQKHLSKRTTRWRSVPVAEPVASYDQDMRTWSTA
jgi:hypothetical protein